MKKILIAVWALLLVSPVMAQEQEALFGKQETRSSVMKQKIASVADQIKIDEFDAAYNSYVELLSQTGSKVIKQQKRALNNLMKAYERLDADFRLKKGYAYFTGKWMVGDEEVDTLDFLEQQKKRMNSSELKSYERFLEKVKKDIADHVEIAPAAEMDVIVPPAHLNQPVIEKIPPPAR